MQYFKILTVITNNECTNKAKVAQAPPASRRLRFKSKQAPFVFRLLIYMQELAFKCDNWITDCADVLPPTVFCSIFNEVNKYYKINYVQTCIISGKRS